jgi:hypothetical protein
MSRIHHLLFRHSLRRSYQLRRGLNAILHFSVNEFVAHFGFFFEVGPRTHTLMREPPAAAKPWVARPVSPAVDAPTVYPSALSPAQQEKPDTNQRQRPCLTFKSLQKICKMVIEREKWLAQGQPIQDIEVTRRIHGPSKNTLRKVTDLALNWEDRAFRWHVATWLRQSSGHTPDEITNHLNTLRTTFSPEDWARLTIRE